MVEILYFADLKDITGKDKENINLNNNKLKELIHILINKYPPIKNLLWDEENQILKNIISIAINDSIIHNKDKLTIQLSDDDKVAFLLPVSGG